MIPLQNIKNKTLNYAKNYCKNALFNEKERVLNFLINKFNFKNNISINNSYNYKSMSWKDISDMVRIKFYHWRTFTQSRDFIKLASRYYEKRLILVLNYQQNLKN